MKDFYIPKFLVNFLDMFEILRENSLEEFKSLKIKAQDKFAFKICDALIHPRILLIYHITLLISP